MILCVKLAPTLQYTVYSHDLIAEPCVAAISGVDPNTLNLDPDPGFWPNLDPDPGLHYQF